MSRKRNIVISLALVAVVAAGAVLAGVVYTGPQRALLSVRDALVAQDADRLGELVDFPVVRASLKAQILSELRQEMGNDPAQKATVDLSLQLVDQMLDGVFTPEGIIKLTASPEASKELQALPSPNWKAQFKQEASTRFISNSRAEVSISDGTADTLVVYMARYMLDWRVVGGRVEKAAAPAVAAQ